MLTLPGTELGAQASAVELLGVQTDSLLGVHTDSTAEVLGVQTDSLEGVHQVLVYSAVTTVAAVAMSAMVEKDILDMWCEAELLSVWMFKKS